MGVHARNHHYGRNADTVQKVTLGDIEVSAKAGKAPYQPSAPREWTIHNTRVALTFDWQGKTADCREWIKVSPYFYPTDSFVLDAKTMRIDSVEMVTKTGNKKIRYSYANDILTLHFDNKISAGDTLTLQFKYTAMPYSKVSGGSMAIGDDKGLYFINTDNKVPNKPAQIWTQGETESNSHWMITVDKPNTRFTTQIELTVPDEMVTLSNGALIKQVKGANKMRTDIWKMDMPIQAYATMFAIGKFSVIKDKWNNKEVNYYVEPEYAPYAKLMFNNTPEMISYFSQITGVPYPWNKYSQVVVRDYVSGAMENTTASLFGDFMNQNAREIADKNSEDVVSHELFHQWFGDYVTCESWSNITVNESFANYGEQLWRRHKYGNDEGDILAWNDLQTYVMASAGKDPQLVRFNYDSREEVFDAISYNKGGAILHYLHTLIGDDAFNRAMNIHLTKNALHSAEAHNWRMAVEEATGKDWNWFFNQWYYHAGHPVLKVNYTYNDTTNMVTAVVSQTQSDSTFDYTLPLKTAVIYGIEKTIVDWNISKHRDTFTYAYKNGVKPLIIANYQHILPGEVKENKTPAQWLQQYMSTDDVILKRIAINGAFKSMGDSSTQALIAMALEDKKHQVRRYTIGQMSSKMQTDKYRKKWTAKLTDVAMHDDNKLVRADAMDLLGEWKVNAGKAAMLAALYDSSYSLAGSALEALAVIDKDTAYVVAKKVADMNPRAGQESAVWSVIGEKGADADVAYFEREWIKVQGSRKFSFAAALNSYLKHVNSDESFTKATEVYRKIVTLETMRMYRGILGGFLFQVAAEQKENVKSENKEEAATAEKRLQVVKVALQKMIDEEPDSKQQDNFKKSFKETFE